MSRYNIPFWKSAPFIRITSPFILGIATCYYLNLSEKLCVALLVVFASLITVYTFLHIQLKFQFRITFGIIITFFIFFAGAYLAALKNPFKNQNAIVPRQGFAQPFYIASVKEPLSEKRSSWKAVCEIESIQTADSNIQTSTNLLLYIKKDSNAIFPVYGSRIAFRKTPERIKNFAEGSAFDYQRYCALKNIHYQVFIKPTELISLGQQNKSLIKELLFKTQDWIVLILRKYINGSKECGLAEALLIGYKNDLDRSLIQSYSNTGVVHVVAISGLHLGLVYSILNMICKPFKRKLLRPAVILIGLWLFSLLAGGSPSVLRSAVMFSSLVIGETVTRKSSVINNLSVSAFFLLCYDPYWLWDLGFVLSYTALLSIVLFMKPVYNIYISENKIIDTVWKLNAVTISAQILTLPVLIYCFGQFPNLFLITNFIAIPLSSIILIGEIILCTVYFAQPIASLCGLVLTKLIELMNAIVEYIDRLPFSSTKQIHVNLLQVVLLYVFIGFISHWLSLKHKSWQ
jgi:competence protein ComEC